MHCPGDFTEPIVQRAGNFRVRLTTLPSTVGNGALLQVSEQESSMISFYLKQRFRKLPLVEYIKCFEKNKSLEAVDKGRNLCNIKGLWY